jgi:hypothetical protein
MATCYQACRWEKEAMMHFSRVLDRLAASICAQ